MKLRQMRIRLGELVDAATICRVFEAEHGPLTWDDLNLLASVEDFHRPQTDEEEPQNG